MMARFELKMIIDHLPRIERKRTEVVPSETTESQSSSKTDYWAIDCAANPSRNGCRPTTAEHPAQQAATGSSIDRVLSEKPI